MMSGPEIPHVETPDDPEDYRMRALEELDRSETTVGAGQADRCVARAGVYAALAMAVAAEAPR